MIQWVWLVRVFWVCTRAKWIWFNIKIVRKPYRSDCHINSMLRTEITSYKPTCKSVWLALLEMKDTITHSIYVEKWPHISWPMCHPIQIKLHSIRKKQAIWGYEILPEAVEQEQTWHWHPNKAAFPKDNFQTCLEVN